MANLLVTLTILCAIAAVVVKGQCNKKEDAATFKQKAEECKKEVGAKDFDVKELMARKPASSKGSKCLRACIMKKYDVMDSNGKLVKSVAKKYAAAYTGGAAEKTKTANNTIDTCAAIKVPDDQCLAAEEYSNCFKAKGLANFETNFLQNSTKNN